VDLQLLISSIGNSKCGLKRKRCSQSYSPANEAMILIFLKNTCNMTMLGQLINSIWISTGKVFNLIKVFDQIKF